MQFHGRIFGPYRGNIFFYARNLSSPQYKLASELIFLDFFQMTTTTEQNDEHSKIVDAIYVAVFSVLKYGPAEAHFFSGAAHK